MPWSAINLPRGCARVVVDCILYLFSKGEECFPSIPFPAPASPRGEQSSSKNLCYHTYVLIYPCTYVMITLTLKSSKLSIKVSKQHVCDGLYPCISTFIENSILLVCKMLVDASLPFSHLNGG